MLILDKIENRCHKFLERFFWIIPLIFYWYTACPNPGWIDSPMIAGTVYALDTSTWVNSHNLFYIVGKIWTWIFPFGEFHHRLNLLCGVFGALTVFFSFRTGLLITENFWASLLGSIAIMFSHSLWWHSTMLEVYTLNTALLTGIIYLVLSFDKKSELKYLYAAGFVWGLSVVNHILMGLTVFGFIGLFFFSPRRKELLKPKVLALFSFFVLMGMQIYLFLFLKGLNEAVLRAGEFSYQNLWDAFKVLIDNTTGGHFKKSMFPEKISGESLLNWRLNYFFLLIINYPSVFLVLGFAGMVSFWRRKHLRSVCIFLFCVLLAQFIWSSNYLIWDMYAFALPVWIIFGICSILGLDIAFKKVGGVKKLTLYCLPSIIIAPILYALIPFLSKGTGFWNTYFSSFVAVENYWDAAEYFGNPNKRHYDRVQVLSEAIFSKLPPGAHLFDDDGKGHYPFALYYQKVLGKRPDLAIHLLFGPEFDDERAFSSAVAAKKLLEAGTPVFVSSLYWPERLFLNQLYRLLGNGITASAKYANGLSMENLVETFPKYKLEKFILLEDPESYIYQFLPRSKNEVQANSFQIEGEHLKILEKKGKGTYIAQALGDQWSAGGHLLWLDNKVGDEIVFQIEIPKDYNGKLLLRMTKSYDFAKVKVMLDGISTKAIEMDLYSEAADIAQDLLLAEGKFKAGTYKLKIQIISRNNLAEARFGVGIDCLKFIPSEKIR
ncbi:MAG: DUF2723 domain-containing protein [bacterium]|nr:DUF2723 domain-containing protein [bacterium]